MTQVLFSVLQDRQHTGLVCIMNEAVYSVPALYAGEFGRCVLNEAQEYRKCKASLKIKALD